MTIQINNLNGNFNLFPRDSTLPTEAMTIPKENDYNGTREYVEHRRKRDPEFNTFWNDHRWSERADYLTKIFGWFVDSHSLNVNFNRH